MGVKNEKKTQYIIGMGYSWPVFEGLRTGFTPLATGQVCKVPVGWDETVAHLVGVEVVATVVILLEADFANAEIKFAIKSGDTF